MKTLSDFEQIIRDQFAEAEATIIPVIRKHNYGIVLIDCFLFVYKATKENRLNEIPDSVGTSLTTINDFLRTVDEEQDKRILEELTALLFIAQINEIKLLKGGSECIQRCLEVMKTTCEIKGYDFAALRYHLRLDSLITRRSKTDSIDLPTKKIVSIYIWNGTKEELKEVAEVLKGKEIINKTIYFRKAFDLRSNGNLLIPGSIEKLESLIFLFDRLYKNGLISVTGKKGHLAPLIRLFRDLDGQPIEKKGNKIMEKIKRNKPLLQRLEEETSKIIRINCKESMRRLSDNG